MKKVVVTRIDNYDYELIDHNKKICIRNIEFYGRYKPQIGDIIYLPDIILEENNLYAFDEIYDKEHAKLDDLIKVIGHEETHYFQRRYG